MLVRPLRRLRWGMVRVDRANTLYIWVYFDRIASLTAKMTQIQLNFVTIRSSNIEQSTALLKFYFEDR
ncbi:MAG: hypothetical protein MUE44_18140 [Oscillatoriaceae cyanobacterium Prado104]|jgi:hypothetical protein|nr:hypothetical protein [Oscillatoriaceae cyanobacterium Prado104]